MSATTVPPSNSDPRHSPGLFLTPTPPDTPLSPIFSANASNGLSTSLNSLNSENTPPPELPSWADFDFHELPALIQRTIPKYGFRNRNPNKAGPLTWIDNDLTETYDPNAKHDPYLHPPKQILSKRPKTDRPFDYSEYKAKKPKLNTWQQGRLEGQRLPVTLSFISDQARTKLQGYGSSLDNWPEGSFILPNGEPDWEGWWASRGAVPESEFFYDLSTSHYFRDRNLLASSKDYDANDLAVEDLSLGHPEARGCKACFMLGHECPLLCEGVYPCECCVEDDIECELILEPPKKARCNSCIKRRIVCQFVTSPETRGPCKSCLDSSLECVAGPKGGRTRTGPCLDKHVEESEYEAQYAFKATKKRGKPRASCIECASLGQYCTLTSSKTSRPPCDRCFASGTPCTYDPDDAAYTTKRPRPARRILDPTLTAPLSTFIQTPSYSLKARPAYHPPPQTSALTTRVGHPVTFNVEDEECNWCADLLYGLLGLQTQTIRVLTTADGYIPVQPPGTFTSLHCPDVEKPHPPSNMCSSCTLSRLAVLACGAHHLSLIPGMADEEIQFSADEIIEFLEPGGVANLAPWEVCDFESKASLVPHLELRDEHSSKEKTYMTSAPNLRMTYRSTDLLYLVVRHLPQSSLVQMCWRRRGCDRPKRHKP